MKKFILVACFLVLALAACGSDTGTASTPPAQPTTPAPTQAPKTMAQQVSDLVANAGLLGHVKTTYGFTGNKKGVLVLDDIGDGNVTNGLTVGEIHLDCFNAQKALWTAAHLDITEVLVQTNMNVVDQYGKQSNELVATCDLTKETAAKFNWDTLDQESAWKVYDNTDIASFLTQ